MRVLQVLGWREVRILWVPAFNAQDFRFVITKLMCCVGLFDVWVVLR